jgi:hypothetical protein
MFSLLIKSTEESKEKFTLTKLTDVLREQQLRLEKQRIEIEPTLYDKYLKEREVTNKKVPREAQFSACTLYPGTWYLKSIDDSYRRVYDRVATTTLDNNNSLFNLDLAASNLKVHLKNL